MDTKLEAERRDDRGKGVARKLRAAGRVPAVFYGHDQETLPLSIDAREMFHVLHSAGGSNVLLDLVVDGKPHLAMPREIQQDHIHDALIQSTSWPCPVPRRRGGRPVIEVGDAAGVKEGGVVEHHLRDLHIESLPQDVPEHIEVDITDLNIGDMIHVRDVVVPDGVTTFTNPDDAVLSVITPAALRVEAELGLPGEEAPEAVEVELAEGEEAPVAEGEEAPAAEEGSESWSMDPWLVAGLGNPGDRYAATRHSAGARVVHAMATAGGDRFRKARFVPVKTAEPAIEGRKVWLATSLRFMNESGRRSPPSRRSTRCRRPRDRGPR